MNELRSNLDLIRREYAENMSMAAKQGQEYYPPAWEVKSQFDAAVGIELWLLEHHSNFNAEELEKKTSMLRGIQNKCAGGDLDNTSSPRVKIEALACWVELTKTYYICIRESRNLTLRGVPNIRAPNFRLPDSANSIPYAHPPDDLFPSSELDAAMGEVFGPRAWVEAVEMAVLQKQQEEQQQQQRQLMLQRQQEDEQKQQQLMLQRQQQQEQQQQQQQLMLQQQQQEKQLMLQQQQQQQPTVGVASVATAGGGAIAPAMAPAMAPTMTPMMASMMGPATGAMGAAPVMVNMGAVPQMPTQPMHMQQMQQQQPPAPELPFGGASQ